MKTIIQRDTVIAPDVVTSVSGVTPPQEAWWTTRNTNLNLNSRDIVLLAAKPRATRLFLLARLSPRPGDR